MNFEKLINQVNLIKDVHKEHQNQLIRDTNFNKDGSRSRAPHFSKRGHVTESDHVFTLVENYLASLGDPSDIHVASDRVSFNGDKIKLNDEYKDIIVEQASTGLRNSYQAKTCKDPQSSFEAATKEKYLNAGVIPLVPEDHHPIYNTIGGLKVKNKTISSDSRTLDDLNKITTFYSNGGYIENFGDDKLKSLYGNAVKEGASEGAISAFVHKMIFEGVKFFVTSKDQNSQSLLSKGTSIIASTIDGSIRGAIASDAAFDKNPHLSNFIGQTAYDVAKKCLSLVGNKEYRTASDKMNAVSQSVGEGFILSSLSKCGRNIGSSFGPLGGAIGSVIGNSLGNFVLKAANKYSWSNSAIKVVGGTISSVSLLGAAVKYTPKIINGAKAIGTAAFSKLAPCANLAKRVLSFFSNPVVATAATALFALSMIDLSPTTGDVYSAYNRILRKIEKQYQEHLDYLVNYQTNRMRRIESIFENKISNRSEFKHNTRMLFEEIAQGDVLMMEFSNTLKMINSKNLTIKNVDNLISKISDIEFISVAEIEDKLNA